MKRHSGLEALHWLHRIRIFTLVTLPPVLYTQVVAKRTVTPDRGSEAHAVDGENSLKVLALEMAAIHVTEMGVAGHLT